MKKGEIMDNIFANAVKKTIVLGKAGKENRFHIALAGTPNYIPRLGVVIWSAAKSNPDLALAFHVFVNELPDDEKIKLAEAAGELDTVIYVHIVDDSVLQPLMAENSKAAYGKVPAYWYRFVAPDTLKGMTDRVLYLDGDVMCRGSLKELAKLDFHGKIAAVVSDRNEKKQAELLGSHRFFNSGMVLINIEVWQKENLSSLSIQEIKDGLVTFQKTGYYHGRNKVTYCDQNILNYLFDQKSIFLQKKYNYIYILTISAFMKKQPFNEEYQKQVLIHFAGGVKPWHSWVQDQPVIQEYAAFQKESPWKDILPLGPTNHRDVHQMARKARLQGKWLQALKWYIKYFAMKL